MAINDSRYLERTKAEVTKNTKQYQYSIKYTQPYSGAGFSWSNVKLSSTLKWFSAFTDVKMDPQVERCFVRNESRHVNVVKSTAQPSEIINIYDVRVNMYLISNLSCLR